MKRLVFVLPVLVALLCLWLALRERKLANEKAVELAAATRDQGLLRDRIADLESALAARTSGADALRAQAGAVNTADGARPPMRTFSAATMRRMPPAMEAFDSPEVRRLMAIDQKGRLDGRFAGLFRALRLPPDQLDRLKQLLLDKQNAPMDVIAAAQNQDLTGSGTPGEIQQLVQQETQAIDNAIRSLLGDTGYEEYLDYERSRSERGVVEQLASRLSYSDAPLTAEQAQSLVDLLTAERATQPPAAPASEQGVRFAMATSAGDSVVSFGPGGSDGAAISDATVGSAQAVLSETQLEALRQLQAEQQARQQMSELLRRSLPMPGEAGLWVSPPAAASGTRIAP